MTKENKAKNNFLLLISMFSLFSVLIIWLIYFVPADSDEFLAYYNIACRKFEGSRLAFASGFDIGCENFRLKLFGYEYTKSYSYLGLSSIVLYSPFYFLFSNIESHYIYGLSFLILFSFLLTKSLEMKWQFTLLPLLYFPLSFIFLHDSGPIKIAMLSLPILILIFKKIFNSNSLNIYNFVLIFVAGATVSIALEDKAFYLFLLPGFIVFAFLIASKDSRYEISSLDINKKYINFKISRNILILGTFFLAIITIAILLLFILSTKYVQKFNFNVPYIGYLYAISPKISFFEQLNYLFLYTLIPISFADRIFEVDKSLFNFRNFLSFLSFLPIILIICGYIKKNIKVVKTIFLLPISILLLIFLILKNTWSGHHFIFLHLFFITMIMFYASNKPKNFFKVSCSLILCTAVSMNILFLTKVNVRSSKEISEIAFYLNKSKIASESIINFSTWGGYLQQSIYGNKSQIVTMTAPINAELASKVNDLRIKKNRKYILNICYSCSLENIKQMYPSAKNLEVVKLKTDIWKVLKISY